jgi:dsRNA-specific ribonuclease
MHCSFYECAGPYHNQHKLLTKEDLERFFADHGMEVSISDADLQIFQTAFVHRSYCKTAYSQEILAQYTKREYDLDLFPESFERLEFLGDSVISLAVTDFLLSKYPTENEGFLTKKRIDMVTNQTQSMFCRQMNLVQWIIQAKYLAEKKDSFSTHRLYACVFESFVGACYTAFGFFFAKNFILNVYDKYPYTVTINYKQLFQEKIMKCVKVFPSYVLVENLTDVKFTVHVYVYTITKEASTETIDVFKTFLTFDSIIDAIKADIESNRAKAYFFGIATSTDKRKNADQEACKEILEKFDKM